MTDITLPDALMTFPAFNELLIDEFVFGSFGPDDDIYVGSEYPGKTGRSFVIYFDRKSPSEFDKRESMEVWLTNDECIERYKDALLLS